MPKYSRTESENVKWCILIYIPIFKATFSFDGTLAIYYEQS